MSSCAFLPNYDIHFTSLAGQGMDATMNLMSHHRSGRCFVLTNMLRTLAITARPSIDQNPRVGQGKFPRETRDGAQTGGHVET